MYDNLSSNFANHMIIICYNAGYYSLLRIIWFFYINSVFKHKKNRRSDSFKCIKVFSFLLQ